MNVLLIGSGGRENAIAWKLVQSDLLSELFVWPGNAGTGQIASNMDLTPLNFESIGKFCLTNKIQLVVVGPEEPLVNGIHDFFLQNNSLKDIPVIGPEKQGAMLEGSKDFAKQFMMRHNIPTAKYLSVTSKNLAEGKAFLTTLEAPYVLKADGLAAGKGVLILNSLEEAQKELEEMLSGKFGKASSTVVIEEFLSGIELSVFVVTDGNSYLLLPEAKDYKRVGEGDSGLNTGGMGAVSPVSFATPDFMKKVEERIIKPTVEGLKKDKIPYKGFIFFGLISVKGEPYVIEYNARMGDPETEVVIPRIKSDFLEILMAVATQTLHTKTIEIDPRFCTTVMLVSGGYPGEYQKGYEIKKIEKTSGCMLFHAGTIDNSGEVLTNGGRVMAVSAYGNTMKEALEICNQNAQIVDFTDKYFRKDIGFDL